MCDTLRDGKLMATEKTLANAITLGKLLMERYSIPIERVIRHFDVTGKHCPAYLMDEAKWAARTVQKLLDKDILRGEDTGLDLGEDMLRLLVVNDRMRLYV